MKRRPKRPTPGPPLVDPTVGVGAGRDLRNAGEAKPAVTCAPLHLLTKPGGRLVPRVATSEDRKPLERLAATARHRGSLMGRITTPATVATLKTAPGSAPRVACRKARAAALPALTRPKAVAEAPRAERAKGRPISRGVRTAAITIARPSKAAAGGPGACLAVDRPSSSRAWPLLKREGWGVPRLRAGRAGRAWAPRRVGAKPALRPTPTARALATPAVVPLARPRLVMTAFRAPELRWQVLCPRLGPPPLFILTAAATKTSRGRVPESRRGAACRILGRPVRVDPALAKAVLPDRDREADLGPLVVKRGAVARHVREVFPSGPVRRCA